MGCFLFLIFCTLVILGYAHFGFWVLTVLFLWSGSIVIAYFTASSRPSPSSQTVSKNLEKVPVCIFFLLGFVHEGFWILAALFMWFWSIVIVRESRRPSPSSQTVSKNLEKVPDDLYNILQSLSQGEIKDPVTQETFRSGEKVYLCHTHRLAYHEDSWQEIGSICMVCGHNRNTRDYILPSPIQIPKNRTNNLIQWKDLKE